MTEGTTSNDFIRQIVREDQAAGKHGGRVATRFPPEPNGYLHLGHGKSICLNFGVAREFGGSCKLRFDDTNPAKEDLEYVEAIKDDVHWLGFEYQQLRHASDYFEVFYRCAEKLIQLGMAYVDDLSADAVREYRGSLTEAGRESPFRERGAAETLRGSGIDDPVSRPQQIEFARGNLDYTVMSKRKLMALVSEGLVDGWDDPRMPTLIGARRRGFPPGAIRTFWERAGVTKQNSVIEFSVL